MKLAAWLVTLLALPALAGCVQPAADADDLGPAAASAADLDALGLSPRVFDGITFTTITGTTESGRTVTLEAWLPDATKALVDDAPDTFPTIMIASPYWGGGSGGVPPQWPAYGFWVTEMVPRGYAAVFGDLAGNGGSGGCWDFMGPVEQESAVALVETVAAQPWSDGKIGMYGISYDGMSQIMAASRVAEHLTTVVPIAPLTHAYAGVYQNGVHYGGGWWATTGAYTSTSLTPPWDNPDRAPGWAERLPEAPACAAEATAWGNDPTGEYNAYYQARDFRPLAKDVNASVFFIQGFLDANVKPDNAFPWFTDVQAPKKLWLGHWFHQIPTAEVSGRTDMFVTIARWFDHELKGIPNGILDEPVVDVQDSQGHWRHEAAWPPADANATPLWLSMSSLATDPGDEMWMQVGSPQERVGTLAGLFDGFAFATPTFDAPFRIAGIPTFHATVASDRPTGMLVARLYEEGDGATPRLVTQGALNLLVADDRTNAQPLTPGAPVTVGFELYPTDHVVPAGKRLVLRVAANEDRTWYTPDASQAILSVKLGGEDGARIVLPVLQRTNDATFLVACGSPIKTPAPDCYQADRKDEGVDA